MLPKYYLVEYADGSKEVLFSTVQPTTGQQFDPLTGTLYGKNAVSVNVLTEEEVLQKYPRYAVSFVSFFHFSPASYDLIDGKPFKNGRSVLNDHSKKIAENARYTLYEPDAPYKIKLPNGLYTECNERGDVYNLLLIGSDRCYTGTAEDLAPLKEWLRTFKN